MSLLDRILPLLKKAEPFGFERLADGTRLIGRVPHVAPEAWLHIVGRPLAAIEIRQLELDLNRPIGGEFRQLLLEANGLSIFSDSISIFGVRRAPYVREGSDSYQPYSLAIPNVYERHPQAPADALFIGSYNWDGSLLFVATDGSVQRCDRDSAVRLSRWSNLEEMLSLETLRLSRMFDPAGGRLNPALPTTP